jgi:deoxyadenosine/deoxycytidine kinase
MTSFEHAFKQLVMDTATALNGAITKAAKTVAESNSNSASSAALAESDKAFDATLFVEATAAKTVAESNSNSDSSLFGMSWSEINKAFDTTLILEATPPIYLISVEGNIGSGKSTLLDQLKTAFSDNDSVQFIPEPVDQWNTIIDHKSGQTMLQRFYAYPQTYAFEFQMMALLSRLALLRKVFSPTSSNKPTKPMVYVSERSVYTDRYVFAQMMRDSDHISDTGFQIYDRWFHEFIGDIHYDHIVYITATPQECIDRVHVRQRPGEENISPRYLEECNQYHDSLIQHLSGLNNPVLVTYLDGHFDLSDTRRLEQTKQIILNLLDPKPKCPEPKCPEPKCPKPTVPMDVKADTVPQPADPTANLNPEPKEDLNTDPDSVNVGLTDAEQLMAFMTTYRRLPRLISTNPKEHALAQYVSSSISK